MEIFFDSNNQCCKTPFGAVSNEQEITFRVFCKNGVFVHNAVVKLYNEEMEGAIMHPLDFVCVRGDESEFCGTVKLSKAGLYWYHFVFDTEKGFVTKNQDGADYQLTVYDKDYQTPDCFKGGVIYHIFVDRFCKGKDKDAIFNKVGVLKNWDTPLTLVDADGIYRANDFYGGNFQGIIDKLDYLESLGVTTLYLSPIFKSASNHRYDTGDYFQLDELLGTEKKFVELIKKAQKKGMYIMLDGVFNHTGADSRYFNKFNTYDSVGAYQSKQSEYYDWYTFYNFPYDYHCWWGVTVCPTVSKSAKGFRQMLLGQNGVIDKWSKMGVRAWRLDVVDELDEPLVEGIRKAVKSVNPDNLLIGEVWEDASNKISYGYRRHYFQGKQLDGVMNYPFKDAVLNYVMGGNKDYFVSEVMKIVENYPKQSLDATMNLIDSHDTIRAMTLFGKVDNYNMSKSDKRDFKMSQAQYSHAKSVMKIASTLQFLLPGIPAIYYGDEGGMQGFEDPMNRMPMPWDNLDQDLLEHYKILGKIRKDYKEIVCGGIKFEPQEDDLLVMKRFSCDEEIIVVANNSNTVKKYYLFEDSINLLSHTLFECGWIALMPYSVFILKQAYNNN